MTYKQIQAEYYDYVKELEESRVERRTEAARKMFDLSRKCTEHRWEATVVNSDPSYLLFHCLECGIQAVDHPDGAKFVSLGNVRIYMGG